MFVPKIYRAKSVSDIKVFVKNNSFASLVGQLDGRPIATHTPLFLTEIDGKDYLVGHIARANEQYKCFDGEQQLLAIFQNQHSYISSSWYKETTSVPTWNYIAVHITGTAIPMTDQETRTLMHNMVTSYEGGQKNPFKIDDLPEEQYKRLLRGIVAFKIEIDTIEAAYKLSQDKSTLDHKNITAELRKTDDPLAHQIADDMDTQNA